MLYGPAIEEEVQYRLEMARRLMAEAALARELRKIAATSASGSGETTALRYATRVAASAWRIAKTVIHATLAILPFWPASKSATGAGLHSY